MGKNIDTAIGDVDKDLEQKLIAALPRRFERKDLEVACLAPLFQFKFQYPRRFSNFFEKVQDRLLDFTVHEAYNQSEFYQRLYPKLSEDDFIDKEKLKDFPLVFRHHVEGAGRSICSKAVDYGFTSYTGGTTTNNSLFIDRSIQEQNFIYNFFLNINKNSKNTQNTQKMVLSLAIPSHGNVFRVPVENVSMFPVAVTYEGDLSQAIKLLKRSIGINGEEKKISCIAAPVGTIIRFTAFCIHTGVNDIEKNIEQIQTGGAYLTKYVSDWLRNFWNCEIIDNFSFAELFFSSLKCRHCGLYHFSPYGITEVLDIDSNQRLDSGRGRLFVTGFYPFTQMTPLIRYSTGDLVEIKEVNCIGGQYGFLCLGREKNSLIFKNKFSNYGFVSGGEVYEVLDGLPDINVPEVADFSSCCNSIGSKPVFWFENDPSNVIHIELRYSPVFYPQRLKELNSIIKARLISECHWLEEMLEKKLISLKFHPPGSYNSDIEYRP